MVSDRPVAVICGFRKQASTAKQQTPGIPSTTFVTKSQPFFRAPLTIVPSMSASARARYSEARRPRGHDPANGHYENA
jgi:hypothetical protein